MKEWLTVDNAAAADDDDEGDDYDEINLWQFWLSPVVIYLESMS